MHITKDMIQIMGKNKDTLKIVVNGIAYMKFHATEMIEELGRYDGKVRLDVVGRANMNEWMGRKTPQIFIESYSMQSDSIFDF